MHRSDIRRGYDYVRSVNGWGARCGCGRKSAMHVGVGLDKVTPETSRFLCVECVHKAVEGYFATSRQPSYWPGDEGRDQRYEAPAHRPVIDRDGVTTYDGGYDVWQARCGCGWTGAFHLNAALATNEGATHEKEAAA